MEYLHLHFHTDLPQARQAGVGRADRVAQEGADPAREDRGGGLMKTMGPK